MDTTTFTTTNITMKRPDGTSVAFAATYNATTFKGAASEETHNFINHATVFVLACFVGWQVIWNVKPALHTPLMSVTNAISGIILVGGMLQLSGATLNRCRR